MQPSTFARAELARPSGFQAWQVAIVQLLETSRDQLGDREYALLVELVGRWLDREQARIARGRRARLTLLVGGGA